MSSIGPKPVRLRLDAVAYEHLRQQVLRRDGDVQPGSSHKQFRSHSGQDSEENLITLCSTCHDVIHR